MTSESQEEKFETVEGRGEGRAENFPNLVQRTDLQIQEAKQT